MTFNTPILIIAWKRPDKVSRILKVLKDIKPQNIYVACDGAKKDNLLEFKKVQQTRNIIEKGVNWKYRKFRKLFNKENLGCKIACTNAINWFFENVNEGIIIEDDCLPHYDFFKFSAIMLEKYREDKRVWCVSGSNHQAERVIGGASYYFSYYPLVWGWATWKRCWDEYDVEMKSWPNFKKNNLLNDFFDSKKELKYWEKRFDTMYHFKKPDTWDYQWFYCCLKNNGLSIIPNSNLIENIGFGKDATHTTSQTISPSVLKNLKPNSSGILPIKYLDHFIRSKKADKYTSVNQFSGYSIFNLKFYISIFKRIINKIKRYLKEK